MSISNLLESERKIYPELSPLSSRMMTSQAVPFLPVLSHSTPISLLPRPHPFLPQQLSPLDHRKLSPLTCGGLSHNLTSSPNTSSLPSLSLSTSSQDSAFSPVERSRQSLSQLSPLSHSYSPLSHASAVTPPTGYLNRLRSNPMFQDLQMLLAQECHHLQVPASLITSQWNLNHLHSSSSSSSSSSSPSRDHATLSSQQVYGLHMQLQDRFLRLHGDKELHETSRKMESLYCSEVGRIEMMRYQALCASYSDQSKYAVNIHYNKERITLVDRMQKEVDVITQPPPVTSTPVTSNRSSSSSSSTSVSFDSFTRESRPADCRTLSTDESSTSLSTESKTTDVQSSVSEESSTSSASTDSAPSTKRSRTGRLLSPETIKMLTDWYDSHMTYPYPSDEDVEDLATRGGITHGQVRKWLANKRVRSFNTLSITGNDHPIKYKYRGKKSCDQTADISANRRPQYKLLSAGAKKVLSDWYDMHSERPYPTEEEKEELAEKAGISTAQVKSWFANKRSRTNNTKKQVPNYFIKKFPGYSPIVEMVSEQRAARKVSGQTVERVRVDLYQPFNLS